MQALKHVHSINQTVHKLADELRDLKARVSNPADAITAQMTALSADVSAPGQETESLAQQALNKQKQLEYKLGKLERVSKWCKDACTHGVCHCAQCEGRKAAHETTDIHALGGLQCGHLCT